MNYVPFSVLYTQFIRAYPEMVREDGTEFKLSCDRKVAQFTDHKNALGFLAGFTCGGATMACLKACYTQRGPSTWPTTEGLKAYNTWVLIKYIIEGDPMALALAFGRTIEQSYNQYCRKVTALKRKGDNPKLLRKLEQRGHIFRWQWSGDLLHRLQAEAIALCSHLYPDTTFWLYTRSFNFLPALQEKADNLMVWLSADHDNRAVVAQQHQMFPWTHVAEMDSTAEAQQRDLVCPELRQVNPIPLQGACASCGICFASKAPHLTFPVTSSTAYRKPIDDELMQIFTFFRQEEDAPAIVQYELKEDAA